MKILVLTYWFPYPPVNGAKMRMYNLLKHLGQRHDLHVITFMQSDEDRVFLPELRTFCREVQAVRAIDFRPSALSAIAGLLSVKPRSAVECYSGEMASLVRRALEKNRFDAAIAFTLRTAEYIAEVDGLPKVLDEENAEAAYAAVRVAQQRRTLSKFRHRMTWVKARRYERSMALRFDAITAVSEEERQEIGKVVPELAQAGALFVVHNGVDLQLLDYQSPGRDPRRIVYTGAVTYDANLDAVRHFCLDILPIIREHAPDVKFTVTGSTGNVDVSELSKLPGVEFVGFVSDVKPIVAGASVVVVPARLGGGSRLKVLEAMALGTPIVATCLGGMGFGAVNGEHLVMADHPEEFARAVLHLLRDEDTRRTLAANAREFVRKRFGWDAAAASLEDAVSFAIEAKGGKQCAGTATNLPTA